ncbi:DUF488 domain-containing protein [Candidatus Nitrospira bockiana]
MGSKSSERKNSQRRTQERSPPNHLNPQHLTISPDGIRILTDRLWPRGLSKEKARIDQWRKDLAPSDDLRKWFRHDPAKWNDFRRRYRDELRASERFEALRTLARIACRRRVTLLFAAANEQQNQAIALKELLEEIR